jgi:hypothetical protein
MQNEQVWKYGYFQGRSEACEMTKKPIDMPPEQVWESGYYQGRADAFEMIKKAEESRINRELPCKKP